MSFALVKEEIRRFLTSPEAEVLALRGAWGVGKTFSWGRLLEEVNAEDRLSRNRYSYLSLFGVGSIDELKFSLFEQSVSTKLIGKEPNLSTFKSNALQLSESLGRRVSNFLINAPYAKPAAPALEAISFFSVRDTLVCLDDLERRGKSLESRDVLGLVSLLKEKRNCKVVLLLNSGEPGMEEFDKYREKVVDIELLFDPTSEECAEIVFTGSGYPYSKIPEHSKKLNITNIRTLKKIERLVRLAEPRLAGLEQEVSDQIIHSLVLYGWAHFRAGDEKTPTLDYIVKIGYGLYGVGDKKDTTDEQRIWNDRLLNYGYRVTDELDVVLANAVKTGYIRGDSFDKYAKQKNDEVISSKSTGRFSDAWKKYHETFDNNSAEVVCALYESFMSNVKHIAPVNLNGTVRLLRELGEDKKANELIEIYVSERKGETELFNLDDYAFAGDITDEGVRKAFSLAYERSVEKQTLVQVVERLAEDRGWNDKDEVVMASASVEDFYQLFKASSGEKLANIVNACLRFGRFSNSNERQKMIHDAAKSALERIGRESEINRRRVRRYGIEIDGA